MLYFVLKHIAKKKTNVGKGGSITFHNIRKAALIFV